MNAATFLARVKRLFGLLGEIACLPVAHLQFAAAAPADPPADADLRQIYRNFTKPHPRYKVFPNKALGAALIDLRQFASAADYLHSVRGKGNAGGQSRKAHKRGYTMRTIDRNEFIDDIYSINVSSEYRQGRRMDSSYREKTTGYRDRRNFLYFGMFSKEGRLVAYCSVGLYANFAATDQLLGYKNQDGVMYLMLTEIVRMLIEQGRVHYFMYDTVFGAQDGLRDFKRRVGFRPYLAHFSIA